MDTSAVICPECRRVVALGAKLPALCFAAVPESQRGAARRNALDTDPRVHFDCMELEVTVDERLAPDAQLAAVEREYADEIAALVEIAQEVQRQRGE